MANYDFNKDLTVARKTETEVGELLRQLYDAKIIEFCISNKYDILAEIKNGQYSFEVKEDFMSWRTGNVALEFSCRGQPSGILISKADFYVYKIHGKEGVRFYLFKTANLLKMISDNAYIRIVNGGDKGSNSMNYLFKYETFIKYGKLMF
jgi:hypothetical protein